MVESKLVELVVAGSNPVGHPTFFKDCASMDVLGSFRGSTTQAPARAPQSAGLVQTGEFPANKLENLKRRHFEIAPETTNR
jgi:hypothetical protein